MCKSELVEWLWRRKKYPSTFGIIFNFEILCLVSLALPSCFSGWLSFCFYTISSWCTGWGHYHSLFQEGRKLITWIWGSNTNGVLRLVSCWCRPVLFSWLLSVNFSLIDVFLWTLMFLVPINPLYLTGRFPELRDALEKLQLNDAALKVHMTTNTHTILRFCYEFYIILSYVVHNACDKALKKKNYIFSALNDDKGCFTIRYF